MLATLKWELSSNSFRVKYLHTFKNSSTKKFVYFPPFIYVFNHLLISVWTHEYLFHKMLHHFVAKIVSALVIRNPFSWLPCLSAIARTSTTILNWSDERGISLPYSMM